VHTAGRRCERETSGMAISNCRSRSGTKTRAVDRITEPLSSKNKMADRRVLEIMPSGAELEVRIHSAPAASHTNSIIGADIDCLGSGRIGQVIVSKCGKDQESSLWPSGTPSKAPAAATLTFDPITAFRPPIARPEPVKRIYLRTGGDGGGKKPPGERQYAQTFEGTAEERLAYAGLPRFTVAASTKPPTRRPTRLHVVLGDPLLE